MANASLTVSAAVIGRFAQGRPWHATVNSAGMGELTIDTVAQPIRRKFEVSEEQLAALREAIVKERYFDLRDEYGEEVPDSSTRILTIGAGDRTKTVKIRYLMNRLQDNPPQLQEARRALRVWLVVRDWFSDPQAVDLRRYDRIVLERQEKGTK
jgi:hypothetical protein